MSKPELTFVYNADSGMLNTLLDMGHKIFSPGTCRCDLCKLTHNHFRKKRDFKKFIEESNFKIHFYHKNEYEKIFGQNFEYPFIKIGRDNKNAFINSKVINSVKDFSELQIEIRKKIDNL